MPLDSASKGAKSALKKQSYRLSNYVDEFCPPEDAPFRSRLHILFSQIEKEFELLYLENLGCKSTTSQVAIILLLIMMIFF